MERIQIGYKNKLPLNFNDLIKKEYLIHYAILSKIFAFVYAIPLMSIECERAFLKMNLIW